jgi:hypothetical protein
MTTQPIAPSGLDDARRADLHRSALAYYRGHALRVPPHEAIDQAMDRLWVECKGRPTFDAFVAILQDLVDDPLPDPRRTPVSVRRDVSGGTRITGYRYRPVRRRDVLGMAPLLLALLMPLTGCSASVVAWAGPAAPGAPNTFDVDVEASVSPAYDEPDGTTPE